MVLIYKLQYCSDFPTGLIIANEEDKKCKMNLSHTNEGFYFRNVNELLINIQKEREILVRETESLSFYR